MPILLAFLLLPIAEIAGFVLVGGWIGLWPTLGLVVATTLLGVSLIRGRGLASLRDLQGRAQGRGNPLTPMAHGALTVLAGFLLVLPGFLTDLLGLLLLLPPVRGLLLKTLTARMVVVGTGARAGAAWPGAQPRWTHDDVIDGDAVEIPRETTALPRNRPSGWTNPPE